MWNWAAISTKPGLIIGPHAPTIAVSMLMMIRRSSFFHLGQFSGSRGLSDGCGTKTISLLRPVPCFSADVSRPISVH